MPVCVVKGPAPVHPAPPDHAGPLIGEAMERFPALRACSFDRGSHSPANQAELGARGPRLPPTSAGSHLK